jgi:prevent-host-death family protein
MVLTPQIQPISELARDHKTLLRKLKSGPVFLSQRGRPAAVVVSPEQWDAMARRLAAAEGRAESRRVMEKIDSGEIGTIRHDDLVKLIAERQADGAAVGD